MSSKTVKNIREPLKRPRPLKSVSIDQSKDTSPFLSIKVQTDLLSELERLYVQVSNLESNNVAAHVKEMCTLLKEHGQELDSVKKDVLDHRFSNLRNISREDKLDRMSRLRLLEIIELRANHWETNDNMTNYYNAAMTQLEDSNERHFMSGSMSPNAILNAQNQNYPNMGDLSLSPGEYFRSSGKYPKPTKISGKNYYKDEIVIRNSDSGKVSAGARDRCVQITGPHEEAISHAKYLVEDTIKRNVSPVRDHQNNDLVVVDNKNHMDYGISHYDQGGQVTSKRNLYHSYSMTDASTREPPSVSVYVDNEKIVLSGARLELLKKAQMVLNKYFSGPLDNSEKEASILSPRTTSIGDNQRFTLKKQASLKDNLPGSFSSSSVDRGFSRQSSSMSSSSDDILPNEESSDLEEMSPSEQVFIPPPTYSGYTRDILLECARLPLSQRQPADYQIIAANFPELIQKDPVMFDPSHMLQNKTSS